jgi:hypothetical protein
MNPQLLMILMAMGKISPMTYFLLQFLQNRNAQSSAAVIQPNGAPAAQTSGAGYTQFQAGTGANINPPANANMPAALLAQYSNLDQPNPPGLLKLLSSPSAEQYNMNYGPGGIMSPSYNQAYDDWARNNN